MSIDSDVSLTLSVFPWLASGRTDRVGFRTETYKNSYLRNIERNLKSRNHIVRHELIQLKDPNPALERLRTEVYPRSSLPSTVRLLEDRSFCCLSSREPI